MSGDQFERVRKHLRLAARALTDSEPRTTALKDRVRTIMRRLDPTAGSDYDGDDEFARAELLRVRTALERLTAPRRANAAPRKKMKQNPAKFLRPGVAEAIAEIDSAVVLLIPAASRPT
jgi:hypothetical protein